MWKRACEVEKPDSRVSRNIGNVGTRRRNSDARIEAKAKLFFPKEELTVQACACRIIAVKNAVYTENTAAVVKDPIEIWVSGFDPVALESIGVKGQSFARSGSGLRVGLLDLSDVDVEISITG